MIDFSQIQTFFVVLAAVLAFVVLFDNAYERAKKRFSKSTDDISEIKSRLDKHDRLLNNDNERFKSLEEETRLVLRGVSFLVSHETNGNDISKLKEYNEEITKFLLSR